MRGRRARRAQRRRAHPGSAAARDEICAELGPRPARASRSSTTAPSRLPSRRAGDPGAAARAGSGLDEQRVVLCVGAEAPAQEPGAARRGAADPPADVVARARRPARALRRAAARAGARARRRGPRRASPTTSPTPTSRGSGGSPVRGVPDARRGLRAAGAGGAAARRAGRVLGHPGAARGRRRRAAHLRSRRPDAAAAAVLAAIADPAAADAAARVDALHLGGRGAGTFAAYERALA